MGPRAYIINVGVNASHGSLRSPIFPDRKFEFVPIPEPRGSERGCPDCPLLPRYRDLFAGKLEYIPARYHDVRAHNDPEFETFTYGDYPTLIPRASNLRHIKKGDYLFFLARMTDCEKEGRFLATAGFYLAGFFEIESVLKEITDKSAKPIFNKVGANAHIKRAVWDPKWYDRFWIFTGSQNSDKFKRAVPFTRVLADRVLVDRKRKKLRWATNRSELQVIGSYTRACRMIEEQKKVNYLLRMSAKFQ